MDGLVVDAAGNGNIAGALFEAVKEAREAGSGRGHHQPDPLREGSSPLCRRRGGTTLHDMGCVFADNLSAQKARVLLIAALTADQGSGGVEGVLRPLRKAFRKTSRSAH